MTKAFLQESDLPTDLYRWAPIPTIEAQSPVLSEVRPLTRIQAKAELVARLGRGLTGDEGVYWNEVLRNGTTLSELEAHISSFYKLEL